VRGVGVCPQEPLDTAGHQAPPLPHEDWSAATRMRIVAQDHEGASGVRIERELAIHAAGLEPPMVHQAALVVPEIGGGDVCRGQLVTVRVSEPDGEGRLVTAVVLDRQGTALHTGEVVDEVLNSGESHSTPFRWCSVIRRVFRGSFKVCGEDYTASQG
jgi:hypothetical protein